MASSLAVSVGLFSLVIRPAGADEVRQREAIAKLLDVGWAASPKARTAADAQYD